MIESIKKRAARIVSIGLFLSIAAAAQTLPEMTFPKIDYTPKVSKGWVGQYLYAIKFDGRQSLRPTKFDYLYDVKIERVHTGFVELTSEVRGAIRTNQPDKNNGARWESWIPIGTKITSWSMQDEFVKTAFAAYPNLGVAAVDKYSALVQLERNIRYTTNGAWVRGRTHYCDLQIDHATGKYTLAVPKVEFVLEGEDWGTRIGPDGKTVAPYREKIKGDLTHQGSVFLSPIEWDILSGDFAEGQREIVVRRRIPVKYAPEPFEERGKKYQLPATTGFIDFYMVLTRVG
ncbi:MAG: hypothetical protein JSS81_06160 [Acidobacteria bacterium]|nr:hypothetical protein [Acidobacteriota bacterium]